MIESLTQMIQRGEYSHSLQEIQNSQHQYKEDSDIYKELQLLQVEAYFHLTDYNSSKQKIDQILALDPDPTSKYNIAARIIRLEIYRKEGNIPQLDLEHQLKTDIAQSISSAEPSSYLHADFLFTLGNCNLFQGKLDDALRYFQEALDYAETSKDDYRISNNLNNMGIVLYDLGNLNEAQDHLNRALVIRREIGNKILIAQTLNNLGIICDDIGHLEDAKDYYQQSLELYNELNISVHIAGAHNNLGEIDRVRGDLDGALDHYQKAYDLYSKQDNLHFNGIVLHNIGRVYFDKKEYSKALDHFLRAASIRQKIGHDNFTIETYFQLLRIHLIQGNETEIKKLSKKFDEMAYGSNNLRLQLYEKLSKALIYKHTPSSKAHVKAYALLEEIADQPSPDNQLSSLAILHLIELLIDELKLFNQEHVLVQINEYVSKLYELAQKQYNIKLIVEVLILLSRIRLIEGRIDENEHLLKQAEILATEHSLDHLLSNISEELVLLSQYIKTHPELFRTEQLASKLNDLEIHHYLSYLRENLQR